MAERVSIAFQWHNFQRDFAYNPATNPGGIRDAFEKFADSLHSGKTSPIWKSGGLAVFDAFAAAPGAAFHGRRIPCPKSPVVTYKAFDSLSHALTADTASATGGTLLGQKVQVNLTATNLMHFYLTRNTLKKKHILAGSYPPLGSARGWVWLTHTRVLTRRTWTVKSRERATRIRNELGLLHISDCPLFKIAYAPSGVDSLHAPTSFDCGQRDIYRSALRADAWGETVCIASLLAGHPEAIHKPIAWERMINRPIGIGDVSAIGGMTEGEKLTLLKQSIRDAGVL